MCGRYTVAVPAEQLAQRFDATIPPDVQQRYNAAPSQELPVLLNEISEDDAKREIQLLRWGLIPHWAKDATIANKMINARAETLAEKPAYRDALKKHRCLVLADSFYEWQKTESGKVPMRIMMKSGEPFAFAGLWSNWKNPDGEWVRTFTIITGKPNDVVAPIHNRMPAILRPEDEATWLDNGAGETIWLNMLQPYPSELMMAYPVSSRVNVPANDDPSLIARAS
jgi:putative SOS response-associated peptidase YedK